MSQLIITASPLSGYIFDTIATWPIVNNEPTTDQVERAAISFLVSTVYATFPCTGIGIQDPVVNLLNELGITLPEDDETYVDHLTEYLDEHLIELSSIAETIITPLERALFGYDYTFNEGYMDTYVAVIKVGSKRTIAKYKNLIAKLKSQSFPTHVTSGNLDAVEIHIDRNMAKMFGNISDPAVREELKHIIDKILKRY